MWAPPQHRNTKLIAVASRPPRLSFFHILQDGRATQAPFASSVESAPPSGLGSAVQPRRLRLGFCVRRRLLHNAAEPPARLQTHGHVEPYARADGRIPHGVPRFTCQRGVLSIPVTEATRSPTCTTEVNLRRRIPPMTLSVRNRNAKARAAFPDSKTKLLRSTF